MNKSTMPHIAALGKLFSKYFGLEPENIISLPLSGSSRRYYRLNAADHTAIGVYGQEVRENNAFIKLSSHFYEKGLPVPIVFAKDTEQRFYLQDDLGDESLYNRLLTSRHGNELGPEMTGIYHKAIESLVLFQTDGAVGLNWDLCYPRSTFDKQSMMWDLNYFKYYYLKLAGIVFDEQKLEDDYKKLTNFLLLAENKFFLYRDFQSRNIMIKDGGLFFIDFQGGRRGAPQYDIASLLYDAKADIKQHEREELLGHYVECLQKKTDFSSERFMLHYPGFVLVRIIQAMGAYGFRGFYEKKQHFLQSIPYALTNLSWILNNRPLPIKTPELSRVLQVACENRETERPAVFPSSTLTISINSFSYKKGIPADDSGHGGGFVFDCRGMNNPGRDENLKDFTGLDQEIEEFFKGDIRMTDFLKHAVSLVELSVQNYLVRGHGHLQASFGCTGGRHRSVYCASELAEILKKRKDVKVEVNHHEIKR